MARGTNPQGRARSSHVGLCAAKVHPLFLTAVGGFPVDAVKSVTDCGSSTYDTINCSGLRGDGKKAQSSMLSVKSRFRDD